jgi:hypothetical protein
VISLKCVNFFHFSAPLQKGKDKFFNPKTKTESNSKKIRKISFSLEFTEHAAPWLRH